MSQGLDDVYPSRLMSDGLHLSPDHRGVLEALLRKHLPDVEVWAYGSRVNGRSHDGSDLDLVLRGPGLKEIPVGQLANFNEALYESTIPFLVEARDWARLPASFRREIERDHVGLIDPLPPSSDWPVLTLRDAGVRLIDCVHKTPPAQESGYPYIAIPQMKGGRLDFESARRISHDDFLDWTKKARPQPHDVVLSRRTNPGVTAIDRTGTEFALGQNLVLLRADGSRVEPAFLKWLVRSPAWWREIGKYLNVGALFDSLRCADVPNFELPIPPLPVQVRIGALLEALDDKIESNRRMNETLEEMVRALFKSWFVDFEPVRGHMQGRPTGLPQSISTHFPSEMVQTEALDVPVGWCTGTLAEVAMARRHNVTPADCGDQTPYIGLEHMPRRSIALGSWGSAGSVKSAKSRFEKGDILFGKLRPYFHKVGIAPVDGVCSTDIVVIAPKSPEWSAFVLATVSSDHFVTYTDQTSAGTRMPRTSWKIMSQYVICMPPSELVTAYQEAVQPLLDKIVVGIHSNTSLASLRDTLLPKLLSGQIRVSQAERVVEAATSSAHV